MSFCRISSTKLYGSDARMPVVSAPPGAAAAAAAGAAVAEYGAASCNCGRTPVGRSRNAPVVTPQLIARAMTCGTQLTPRAGAAADTLRRRAHHMAAAWRRDEHTDSSPSPAQGAYKTECQIPTYSRLLPEMALCAPATRSPDACRRSTLVGFCTFFRNWTQALEMRTRSELRAAWLSVTLASVIVACVGSAARQCRCGECGCVPPTCRAPN